MISFVLLLSCKESGGISANAQANAPSIQTAPIQVVDWLPTLEVTGSVEPVAMVQLGFDVPGRIEALLVKRGQRVHKGDALARLDSRMAAAQLAQAKAAYEGAEAQVDAAELAWGRVEKLKEANGISDQVYTDTRGQIAAARAGLQQAAAAVRLAQTYLSNHTLRSPIDGVVTNAPDNAGMLVGAGTPMFLVEDLSQMRLKSTLSEDVSWVASGMNATIKAGVPGSEVQAEGRVSQVIPSLDMVTRRLPVEIEIAQPPSDLKAHSFAHAIITGDVPQKVYSVPSGALVARPDFSVFTVTGPEAKPVHVSVAVLERKEDTILITGNLSEGMLVVLDPSYNYGVEQ